MGPCLPVTRSKLCHFLAEQAEDPHRHVRCVGQQETDGCARIEWIRIILIKAM
jgi:hypothetical protein